MHQFIMANTQYRATSDYLIVALYRHSVFPHALSDFWPHGFFPIVVLLYSISRNSHEFYRITTSLSVSSAPRPSYDTRTDPIRRLVSSLWRKSVLWRCTCLGFGTAWRWKPVFTFFFFLIDVLWPYKEMICGNCAIK